MKQDLRLVSMVPQFGSVLMPRSRSWLIVAVAVIGCSTRQDPVQALHTYVGRDDAQSARQLLQRDPQLIEAVTNSHDRNTPLHTAALAGSRRSVRLLLELGAKPDTRNVLGQTALHVAASAGRAEIVAILLDADTDIDREDGDGNTPLLLAVIEGNAKTVGVLLSRHASTTKRNANGYSALEAAKELERDEVVDLLRRHEQDKQRP